MAAHPALNARTSLGVIVAAWALLALHQAWRRSSTASPAPPAAFSLIQALHPAPLDVAGAGCPTASLPRAGGQWVDECLEERGFPWEAVPAPPLGDLSTREELIEARQQLAAFAFAHQERLITRAAAAGCAPKVVAFICRGGMSCGGLGDRIRGITVAFFQALLTDSVFVTQLTRPLPLTTFFESATLSPAAQEAWLACAAADGVEIASWQAMDSSHLQEFDYREGWAAADVAEVATNAPPFSTIWGNPQLAAPLAELGLANVSYPLAAALAIYMHHGQPTPLLRAIVAPLVAAVAAHEPGVVRVGLQIRTGGDGSFPDPARHPVGVTDSFAARAVEVCSARSAQLCILFVTSDHPQSVQIVQQHLLEEAGGEAAGPGADGYSLEFVLPQFRLRIVYLHQEILHLDRDAAGGPRIEAVSKPYADWFVLAYHMDHLLISSSGYGVSAALANFTPRDMFSIAGARFLDPAACEEHHCLQLRGAW